MTQHAVGRHRTAEDQDYQKHAALTNSHHDLQAKLIGEDGLAASSSLGKKKQYGWGARLLIAKIATRLGVRPLDGIANRRGGQHNDTRMDGVASSIFRPRNPET
eukprot:CAMPEP_0194782726 /NCGR_PEP_ID=MMETSP0323_2-20130528/78844_1 /TAXON_ID=2866 ORGANISM="Crypthecodinium cohnii, Strain Seligo" /NCGR_SAMPLE_ID=MMETSP0323_2 /ASSEMBLY_ACC=CAM_ASM_000346 /LENGTH=103 /DNA_ID=CAMNT_0039721559 /DNA_START=65 /DNA_END=376 /DNA_ORIENTATION=-